MLAGTLLHDLGEPLWEAGLSLANQGDIDLQTIIGATSTGTKGSGTSLTNLSARITALELVDGRGQLVTIDSGDDLLAAQVALGLLGVVTTVQIQTVPRYFLKETVQVMHHQDILDRWDEFKANHRHFSFWWMPTDHAHALYGFDPVATDLAVVKFLDEVPIDDGYELKHEADGRIGRAYLVYPDTTTDPTFHEMEYMLPADRDVEAFQAMRDLMLHGGHTVDSPLQFRWQKQDSGWLSPQYGRETVAVSVSGVIGTDYEPFFHEVNALLQPYGARPHWGKWNSYSGADFASVYPQWDAFNDLRRQYDPDALFTNPYLRDVFHVGG